MTGEGVSIKFFTLKPESELMVHDYSSIVAQVCEKLILIINGN